MMYKDIKERIDNNWFEGAQQGRKELHFIYDLIERLGARLILEIGTGCGALTTLLAMTGADVITVDQIGNPKQWWEYREQAGDVRDLNIIQILANSQLQETRDKVLSHLKGKPDIVILDADHYKGGQIDWELYHELASVVCIHDIVAYNRPEYFNANWFPHYFWKYIKDGGFFRTEEMIDVLAGGWGVIYK